MSVTSEAPAAFRNAATRPGPLSLIGEAIREVASRRRLVRYLVQAEVKRRGANTFLGNIWWVLDPLLLMVVYVVLVTIIARRPVDDYALFIFAAILPWKWFTSAVTDATVSIVNQHRLVKQIAFPKVVLPIAAVTAGVVGFGFGMIALAGIMLLYLDRLSPLILLVPVIAVVQYVFTIGMALLVAAGNVFVRDLGNVMRHLLRLWFYLSPGLYSLAMLEEVPFVTENPLLLTIARLNPFAILFEAYRSVIYGTPDGPPVMPDWAALSILLVLSIGFVAVATVVFKRLEPNFAKVL
jgi:lipopolysaccharide transport system permease protein